MLRKRLFPVLVIGLAYSLSGCGMGHDALKDPSSVPIAPINFDALFVVNGTDNSVSVINTSTQQVVGTIMLRNASFPHHMSLSPDGSALAIAIPGVDLSTGHGGHGNGGHGGKVGAVLILDASNGMTRTSRRLDASNHNAVFSPDGKEIWTSQITTPAGTVLILDASTLATMHSITVGNLPAEVSFNLEGNYAFVANGMSNNVTVIDAASKVVVKTIAVDSGPVGAWPGSDGLMYVDNEAGKSLTAIDGSTLEVIRTYALGFMPGMAAIAPNGELWVTDAENGKVTFYSAASDSIFGGVATGKGPHGVVFSGEGKTAYVSNQTDGTISVIDITTHSIAKTIAVGGKPNGMILRKKP